VVLHSSFAACPRRLWLRAREFAFVAYSGHPAFTLVGATATPMAPPRSIALCKKPDTLRILAQFGRIVL